MNKVITSILTIMYIELIYFNFIFLQVECLLIECEDNVDCPSSRLCVNSKCVDPCSLPSVCGPHADCTPSLHAGVCSCQPGYTGDPRLGCVSLQFCGSDSQCSAGTKCNNGICLCKFYLLI